MARAKILVDTGFWIALYTPEKPLLHERAMDMITYFENNDVYLPWPTLYEFVNTRLARRKENLYAFHSFLQRPNVYRISDEIYKDKALTKIYELNFNRTFSISLIDELLRQIILDEQLKWDYFITFNRVDFEYPCQLRNVLVLE